MTENNANPFVLTSQKGAIQVITLNRPDKSNALHPDLVSQLTEILDTAANNQQIAVIVITGTGRSFSAGLDLELLLKWTSEEKLAYLDTVIPLFRRLWEMRQPVIAAVNGPAIAGGFDLAAFCDVRLASTEAI
jgi:enoyl-CoA hydratase/carnithine racemase